VGKKPDQIEREISEHRDRMTVRLQGLQSRMQEDVETVRTEAKARTSEAIDGAKGNMNVDSVKRMMEEHTLSTMAGAVGLGVLAGVVSDGLGSGNGSSHNNNSNNRNNSAAGFGLGGLVSSLLGPAATTAQDEFQQLVREGFSTLRGKSGDSAADKRVENRDVGVE